MSADEVESTSPGGSSHPDGSGEGDRSLPAKPDDIEGFGARIGTGLVRFYQHAISPLFPPSCRFQPTCSEYTKIAIQRYGLVRGSWMGLKRLLKCHPFHPGGHDPVP